MASQKESPKHNNIKKLNESSDYKQIKASNSSINKSNLLQDLNVEDIKSKTIDSELENNKSNGLLPPISQFASGIPLSRRAQLCSGNSNTKPVIIEKGKGNDNMNDSNTHSLLQKVKVKNRKTQRNMNFIPKLNQRQITAAIDQKKQFSTCRNFYSSQNYKNLHDFTPSPKCLQLGSPKQNKILFVSFLLFGAMIIVVLGPKDHEKQRRMDEDFSKDKEKDGNSKKFS